MSIDAASLRGQLATALGESLQLGDVLGAGGFAAVFRAHDPFLERDVAIKVLDPSLGLSHELEEQFLNEARVVAGVEHPHIVPLYAAESKNGLLYLVMRLLPGQSLADRLKGGPLPAAEAARIAHEVAQALAAAHERGVVHRDIKPENILLDAGGHAIVTDFGIAMVTARPSKESLGSSTGTPHYMSPEQAMGEAVDGRADVYSLGIVLYRMLTGALPFEGRNLTELISKQVAQAAPKVSESKPDTPAALVVLTERLLTKDRNARPTAAEAVTLLAAARTPEAMLTPKQASKKRWRKRGVLFGVAAASGGVVLIGAIYLIVQLVRALFLDPGGPPALSVVAPNIPDSLVQAARAEGSLHAGETVRYAFIPAGHTAADALLWTDSAIVRRSPAGARRFSLDDADVDLNRHINGAKGTSTGRFIIKHKLAKPDTLYDALGGQEITTLLGVLISLTADDGKK
jgi:serine/threonine-protein kinase